MFDTLNWILRNVSLAAVVGAAIVFLSSLFPTTRYIFIGGNSSSDYGFPFTYLVRYFEDLIGPGTSFNMYNLLADYFVWLGVALLSISAVDQYYQRSLRRAKAALTVPTSRTKPL